MRSHAECIPNVYWSAQIAKARSKHKTQHQLETAHRVDSAIFKICFRPDGKRWTLLTGRWSKRDYKVYILTSWERTMFGSSSARDTISDYGARKRRAQFEVTLSDNPENPVASWRDHLQTYITAGGDIPVLENLSYRTFLRIRLCTWCNRLFEYDERGKERCIWKHNSTVPCRPS